MKKLLLCMMLVLMTVSPALSSEPSFSARHCSLVDMKDGKADLSTARFYAAVLEYSPWLPDTSYYELPEPSNATMTLSGGTYSYWDGKALQTVRGTAHTFRLIYDRDYDSLIYFPAAVSNDAVFLLNEADGGLNGVNVSCNFPDDSSLNVSGTVPDFRTTQEQLASFAPYIEYVYSADEFAGIRVRLVNSSNVSVPVPQNRSIDISVGLTFVKKSGHDSTTSSGFGALALSCSAGETPEGTMMLPDFETRWLFDEEFTVSDLLYVYVDMTVHNPEAGKPDELYTWYYSNARNHLTLWANQTSNAGLLNGKSDYRRTKFGNLYINLGDDLSFHEAKHFTSEGRIMIPGGGYTVRNLGAVPEGQDTTYRLITRDSKLVWRWRHINLGYELVDSEGKIANGNETFFVETEKALNGRTLTWTFPDELDLNGSAVVPEFKSTAEQLAQGVPYIELLTSGDMVYGAKYRIVTANDTNTAITPNYRTDWGISVFTKDGDNVDGEHVENSSSGELTFWRPDDWGHGDYTIEDVERVRVRLITYENPDNPCVYQWNFRPSFSTGLPEGIIQPTQPLTSDVLENIVQAVDGITSADEISYITSVNIGSVSDPTDEMTQTVQEDSHEIIGALNTLSVDKSGWYVMKITLSDELFEAVRGMKPEELKVYAIANSDSQAQAALISGILNTWEILSLSGEKIDTIGARELLMVGLLNAGQSFSMFLTKLIIAFLAGGCTTGFTFAALLTTATLFIIKKH